MKGVQEMEKRGLMIQELFGEPWNAAITSVIEILNRERSDKLFYHRDKFYAEDIAIALGVRFDCEGNIIK